MCSHALETLRHRSQNRAAHHICTHYHPLTSRSLARLCKQRLPPVRATPDEFDAVGGDKKVQDALVEVLRVEMKKQQVRDEVDKNYQEGVQQLRTVADEAKAELDRIAELNKMRANLSLDSTLADVMQEADEFEAQLRKNREAFEAGQQEFADWEQKIRRDQNAGLFFQGLYKADKREKEQQGGRTPIPVDKERIAAAAAAVKQPAQEEVRSPLRMWVSTYMVVVLVFAVGQDLLSQDPSYGVDTLYMAIAGALGFNAYGERKALLEQVPENSDSSPRSSSGSSSSGSSSSSSSSGDVPQQSQQQEKEQ